MSKIQPSPKPEPEWWAEARRLRAEGWKCSAIAAHFGVHDSSVQYALHDFVRTKRAARSARYQASMSQEQRDYYNARERRLYARRKKKSAKKVK